MWILRTFKKDVAALLGFLALSATLVFLASERYQTSQEQFTINDSSNVPALGPFRIIQANELNNFELQQVLSSGLVSPSTVPKEEVTVINPLFQAMLLNRTRAARAVLAEQGMDLPDSGGIVKRVLVITTWRSGSTFTGELLSSVPGVFYNYEPLMYVDPADLYTDQRLAADSAEVISNLLTCNYEPLKRYFRQKAPVLLVYNKLLRDICHATRSPNCLHKDILSVACQHFPMQVTKVVRLPLRHVLPLLRQPELNLHVVLLVRDPRGTIASRRRLFWCQGPCGNRTRLCAVLRSDYESAVEASQQFPDTFTVLRYEDLALDPQSVSAWLLQRLGIPQTPSVREYIQTHTSDDGGGYTTTTRKRGSRIASWRKTLPWEIIQDTQDNCSDVLKKFGYVSIKSPAFLKSVDTVVQGWNFTTSAADTT